MHATLTTRTKNPNPKRLRICSYAEAAKWYRRAAERGHVDAQLLLGLLYRKGRGVQTDYVQAHMWYNLAAAGTPSNEMRSKLKRLRDILAESMTLAQIAEAERLAREWKPKKE